jgi:nicotinate-nucleotide--dimethylbenzimidazole phosphoribosyltransferase
MESPADVIASTAAAIRSPDAGARDGALARQRQLTKPAGSLGRLEEFAVRIAGIRRDPAPRLRRKVIVVAAADHGVAAEGVSAYPPEVTAQMLHNFLAGGAAVNVLAALAGAEVRVGGGGGGRVVGGERGDRHTPIV